MKLNKYKKNNHHHYHNLKSRSNPTIGDQDPHYATALAFRILTLGADVDGDLTKCYLDSNNEVIGLSCSRFLSLCGC